MTDGIRPARASQANTNRQDTAGRQWVAFTFYRLRPSAYALTVEERQAAGEEFVSMVETAARHLLLWRSYSLVGLRGDADLLLWQVADAPSGLQAFASDVRRSQLAAHLEVSYYYLALTRRSIYVDDHTHPGQEGRRTDVQPAEMPYLFVYPFVKTRAWYALPVEERQRMMNEHIAVGHRYPEVKINTTYSFGIDDQEFVLAFEAQKPEVFLDLVMDLRSSEASRYTLRDTPAFTSLARPLPMALSQMLGLPTDAVGTQPSQEGVSRVVR